MNDHQITLNIPDSLYQRLQHFAQLAGHPLENLLLQTLTASLPPLPEDLPTNLQTELLKLEQLNDTALWKIAHSMVSDKQQNRYNHLLEKQRDNTLNQIEQDELETLFQHNEQQMLHKAYAYALLKWRGRCLPPLSQLPTPAQRHIREIIENL